MATQPIEEAVTSAGTNNVSVNSAGQNGTVNSANNDIYKNVFYYISIGYTIFLFV